MSKESGSKDSGDKKRPRFSILSFVLFAVLVLIGNTPLWFFPDSIIPFQKLMVKVVASLMDTAFRDKRSGGQTDRRYGIDDTWFLIVIPDEELRAPRGSTIIITVHRPPLATRHQILGNNSVLRVLS